MGKMQKPTLYKDGKAEDAKIRQAVRGSVEYIEASGRLKERIDRAISEKPKKEEKMTKHFQMKKVVIGVAAACLVMGMVCFAGSKIKILTGGSSAYPDYTDYADMGKAEETVGYDVRTVEEFGNGFRFSNITIGEEAVLNESGQEEESQKSIIVRYQKGGEDITLFTRRLFTYELDDVDGQQETAYDETLEVDGILAGFHQIINKFVPPDYELTEEDEKNMENPNFNLAYGSSEVEENVGFSVIWVQNGIQYNLYGTDLSMTGSDMLNMAREIIENGE